MASVVASALDITLSLFLNKARRSLAENLKDGDLNSQDIRSLITTNMEAITSKIDGQARRELLSSASFIQDGLFLLNDLLNKPLSPQAQQESVAVWQQESEVSYECEGVADESVVPTFDDLFGYVVRFKSWLNRPDKTDSGASPWGNPDYVDFAGESADKLVQAVSRLKKRSPEQFREAMESFENAFTRATDEFWNTALSEMDRVVATKLRIQSSLLKFLENPALARDCKRYLKDLHALPEIVEIFRYDLEGGMLSTFNATERHELVQSISMINFVLFRFLNHFTAGPVVVYDWPLIEHDNWTYHPLIPDEAILAELMQAEIEVPNIAFFKPIQSQLNGFDPKLTAINSEGDLIAFRQQTEPDEVCELLKISGNEVEVFYTFPEFSLVSFVSISDRDCVYVFADNVSSGTPQGYLMYDVYVFSSKGDLTGIHKNFMLLDGSIVLAPTPRGREIALCIPSSEVVSQKTSNQGRVITPSAEKIQEGVNKPGKENVHEEVNTQEVVPKELANLDATLIEINMAKTTIATITDSLEAVAMELYGHHVRLFDQDGRFLRKFKLRGGKTEACIDVSFNNTTKDLVVVSRVENDYFLSTYDLDSGRRHRYVRLAHIGKDCHDIQLTSHCSGSMALVTKEHVLYLQ